MRSIKYRPSMSRSAVYLMIAAFIFSLGSATFGQSSGKLATAKTRIDNSTQALKAIAELPAAQSIPAELLTKAQVIAVFPNITKTNMFFMKAMKGSGLAARRTDEGWGTPVFYQFVMIDKGWTTVEGRSPSVVMLFMSNEAFKKDHIDISNTVAGPVGDTLSDADKKRLEGVRSIAYGLSDGKLIGVKIEESDSTQSGLNVDNAMNKPVFGKKGTEVFWAAAASGNDELKALQAELERF